MHTNPLTPETGFALEVFLLDAQARNLSPRTVHYYRQQVGWFNSYLAQQSWAECRYQMWLSGLVCHARPSKSSGWCRLHEPSGVYRLPAYRFHQDVRLQGESVACEP